MDGLYFTCRFKLVGGKTLYTNEHWLNCINACMNLITFNLFDYSVIFAK